MIKGIFAIEASYGLHELEEYLTTSEEFLQKAKLEFEAWATEQEKKLSPKEHDEFYEFYEDEHWRYSERFPRILRNSFLVLAHSLLEKQIARLCSWLRKKREIPIGWADLRGDVLDRAKLYFKLAGLPIRFDDQTWREINYYTKVRNCIVHENGLIKRLQDDQDFTNYITRKGIISTDMIEQEIALTEQFCEEVIKTMSTLMGKLFEAREESLEARRSEIL